MTACPSRDLLQAVRQQITHGWWQREREKCNFCLSQIVLDEAAAGDPDAARGRSALLERLPLLDFTDQVDDVAPAIMDSGPLPPNENGYNQK